MQTDAPAIEQGGIKEFQKRPDLFRALCWVASAATVATLAWIIFEIGRQAMPAVQKFGLEFLTDSKWVPNREIFGVAPFLIGTAVSSLIALDFRASSGAFDCDLPERGLSSSAQSASLSVLRWRCSRRFRASSTGFGASSWSFRWFKGFGAWAVVAFKNIPILNTIFAPPAYGNSMLTASLVLALMILPDDHRDLRSALVAVPGTLREGAYALGSTRWEAIFGVILPTAAPGIVAATILALGRAMGETMAIAMLIGNSSRLTWSLLSPAGTLAGLAGQSIRRGGRTPGKFADVRGVAAGRSHSVRQHGWRGRSSLHPEADGWNTVNLAKLR